MRVCHGLFGHDFRGIASRLHHGFLGFFGSMWSAICSASPGCLYHPSTVRHWSPGMTRVSVSSDPFLAAGL